MKSYRFMHYGSVLLLLSGACEPADVIEQTALPKPSGLEGRWQYDSTGLECYSASLKSMGGSTEPMRAGAILTIDTGRWVYSGSLHEVHAYSRTGHTVFIRRIGDHRMVQSGYISADGVGQAIAEPDKHEIMLLTPTRLIMRDSTTLLDANGSVDESFCVRKYYYSR